MPSAGLVSAAEIARRFAVSAEFVRDHAEELGVVRLGTGARPRNECLERDREAPIAVKLTPHSLRRTFASLLYALGEAPPYVMRQMGHTSPHLALAVYAREMDRRDGEPERLRALVDGRDWALTGISAVPVTADADEKVAI